MSEQTLNTEIRRVQRPNEHSLNLCIPRHFARMLEIECGSFN